MGWKNNEFEVENLVKFFLIAFGWTWLYWSLFIFQVINLPPGIGTPNARAIPWFPRTKFVSTFFLASNIVIIIVLVIIYGPKEMIRKKHTTLNLSTSYEHSC